MTEEEFLSGSKKITCSTIVCIGAIKEQCKLHDISFDKVMESLRLGRGKCLQSQ
jgi:hypothetical protein